MTHRRGTSGYTLVEMMVVVGIIVLLISIAVPSFTAMAYSTQRSLAENSLRRAVTAARDVALRSERGGDGAVMFLMSPDGRMSIVPAEQVGSFEDRAGISSITGDTVLSPPTIRRDLFVPTPFAEAITLPAYWNVRGFAPPGSMLDASGSGPPRAEWYNSALYGGAGRGAPAKAEGNWVLPETGLYDPNEPGPGGGGGGLGPGVAASPTGRQSFMVRFDARSGALSGRPTSSIMLDPRPSAEGRPGVGDVNFNAPSDHWTRVDRADDLARWATRVITDPDRNGNGIPHEFADGAALFSLIGRSSNDTVLVKPVTRLALADERRLASGVRAAGLNRRTRTLYAPFPAADSSAQIELDDRLFGGQSSFDADIVRRNINSWILGDTANDSNPRPRPDQLIGDGVVNLDPDDDVADDRPEAALFVMSPYSGELVEVDP